MSDSARETQQAVEEYTAAVDDATPPQPVPVNMYETTEAVVVVAPLPAVMPSDVEVEVAGRTLTIRAALRTAAPKRYILSEWSYGPYERTVELPEGFGRSVDASMANGQLAVRVLRGDPEGGEPLRTTPATPGRGGDDA
jgi:HSP20 family molecular chaperone IbpA